MTSDPQTAGGGASRPFPIMHRDDKGNRVQASVPWELLAPFGAQAQANHSQSLERLAERGGLCWTETAQVLLGKPWATFKDETLARAFVLCRVELLKLARQPSDPQHTGARATEGSGANSND